MQKLFSVMSPKNVCVLVYPPVCPAVFESQSQTACRPPFLLRSVEYLIPSKRACKKWRLNEIQHVKQALKANNYSDWMITIPNSKTSASESEESRNERRLYASVPYIKGISERLQECLNHTKSHTRPQAF